MKKISLIIIFTITLILIFTTQSCERDDICAESTATTPHLIVRFYNVANQENTKSVTDLRVYGVNDLDEKIVIPEFDIVDTDSIALPLRTDANETKFILHRDYAIDDNDTPDDDTDDFETGNPDVLTVTYTTEQVYVSRACGFKTIFNDLAISIEQEADDPDDDLGNWLEQFIITATNNTVEDETAAHINIFH